MRSPCRTSRDRFRNRRRRQTPGRRSRRPEFDALPPWCAGSCASSRLGSAWSAAAALAVGRADRRHRAGGGLPQPARDRQPHRLPAEAADARLLGRRRAARRVRRGAAQLHADRADPQGDAGRRARHRGRALLQAQRRRLRQRDPRRPGQLRRGHSAPGRLDHHDAGRAQFLSVDRENIYSQDLRDVAVASRSKAC